jgi:hypothetical protein
VGEQLERMGHGVTILTEERGEMAAIATERGLRVVTSADEAGQCDVVYAQDVPSAYALAGRYRDVPQAFCVHHTEHDRWVVPQLPGVTSVAICLHEQAARHARSLGHVPEVVRLRQPVDTRRFSPRGPIGATPTRALLLGNYLSGNRLDIVRQACSEAGIEVVRRGLQADFARSPEAEINDSDIVIGKSRVIVEAMACGRAAYVYDHNGGDGWVTPKSYPALERANFDGEPDSRPLDLARLREDLVAYRPDMGPANRDLALANHGARAHCEALVEVLRGIVPRKDPEAAPLDELGRLARLQWRADARALGFEQEAKLLRTELARSNREGTELRKEIARIRAETELRGVHQRLLRTARRASRRLRPSRAGQ